MSTKYPDNRDRYIFKRWTPDELARIIAGGAMYETGAHIEAMRNGYRPLTAKFKHAASRSLGMPIETLFAKHEEEAQA